MKLCTMLLLALSASAAFAQDGSVLRWQRIEGVITAPAIDNPVGGISSGALPWSARSGAASVNLRTGGVFFFVEGLVFAGGNSIGTTGPVASVVGTLVCNTGSTTAPAQQTFDTAAVTLSPEGNAQFSGVLTGLSTCSKPVFLIRAGARWIASGMVVSTSASSGYGHN
jgi:hypothetical protein